MDIKSVLEFIDANLNDPDLSLAMIAEQFDVSQYSISKGFKRRTGYGYKHYVIARKIEAAKKLLEQGSSVTDACYAVGYYDIKNFSKAFKRMMGAEPSAFKAKKIEIKICPLCKSSLEGR